MSAENDLTPEELAALDKSVVPATWPIVVKLRHPIPWGANNTITELSFNKGQLGFLKGVQIDVFPPPVEQLIELASRLCVQPTGVIERLDSEDADEVLAIALGFIGRCRGIGKKPLR